MSDIANILIVEDEEFNRVMLQGLLTNQYQTACVNDGESCLASIKENKPDLVILDVDMPGIDGLETCRILRKQYNDLQLQIIFVSGMTTDDDRLEGYKAGGNDYITKPYNEKELLHKIGVILQIENLNKQTQLTSLESEKIAKEALNNVFEIGHILNFVKNSFNCSTCDDLAVTLFEALKLFNLHGSVVFISSDGKEKYFFDDGVEREMEKMALKKVHETDKRNIDFGSKTIFNAPLVTMLIRNMPLDDKLQGRLKDNLSTLIEALNSRVKGINSEAIQFERHKSLITMMDATKKNLLEIEAEQSYQQREITTIISGIGSKIEHLFINLGLEESQEQAIINVITEAESYSDELFSQSIDLESRFNQIIKAIENTQ